MSNIGFELEPAGEEPPRRRASGIVVFVAIAVVFILIVSIAVIGGKRLTGFFGAAPDYDGAGSGRVVIVVSPGDSSAAIGETLDDADVVKSAEAFTDAASADDRARSIQPGSYALREHMSAERALDLLLDPQARVVARAVIPEGTRQSRIFEILHDTAGIPIADLEAAAEHPGKLGLPGYAKGQLEGFLFPATYEFEPGTSARAALRAMVKRFTQEADAVGLEDGAQSLGYSPYDVVTVASLIEKEARLPRDFGKVARVAYNRLGPAWGGKPLGFDSTLNYLLPERQGQLQSSDLTIDSPYNSRTHAGLPPTPIDSPGTASLEAALHPTPGDWLYFVTIDQDGNTAFSTTYDQFLQDKRTSRANGVR